MSIGGFGAAAYVGVLPAPVQQVMHDAVGAPAPSDGTDGPSGSPTSRRQPVAPPTAGTGNPTANAAAPALCRAWATDQARGTVRESSVAFRALSAAAGGPDQVAGYCAAALATGPGQGAPTASLPTAGGHPTSAATAPGSTISDDGHTKDGKGDGNGAKGHGNKGNGEKGNDKNGNDKNGNGKKGNGATSTATPGSSEASTHGKPAHTSTPAKPPKPPKPPKPTKPPKDAPTAVGHPADRPASH